MHPRTDSDAVCRENRSRLVHEVARTDAAALADASALAVPRLLEVARGSLSGRIEGATSPGVAVMPKAFELDIVLETQP